MHREMGNYTIHKAQQCTKQVMRLNYLRISDYHSVMKVVHLVCLLQAFIIMCCMQTPTKLQISGEDHEVIAKDSAIIQLTQSPMGRHTQ